MKVDLLIRHGRILDPARGIDRTGDLAVRCGRIAALPPEEPVQAARVIDASGCLVVPGLIDYHTHINYRATDVGVPPDLMALPKGVTSVVDCGSSGPSNCLAFLDRLAQCVVKAHIYVHISPLGLATQQFYEPLCPEKWDMGQFEAVFDQGGPRILGIKMRLSNFLLRDIGLRPFYEMLKVADRFGKGVLVHPSDPPVPQQQILDALRPGDVYCHTYQGQGYTLLEGGEVVQAARRARERGVLFDVAHGGANFDFEVAERALEQGFLPDMISTDTTKKTWNRAPVYSLPHVMSKFLMLGMSLPQVIACVTQAPARAMGCEGQTGTLCPGARGDIAVLRLEDRPVTFTDAAGRQRHGRQLLVPVATIVDGLTVYQDPLFQI